MPDTTTQAGRRAEQRLREEEFGWLTTVRRDGQPQSVPVWFLWNGETMQVYPQPDRQKLRNIGWNPRVGFNLNSDATGDDVARAECTAEIPDDAPPATDVPEYLEKYRDGIAHRPRPRELRADVLRSAPAHAPALAGLVKEYPVHCDLRWPEPGSGLPYGRWE